MSKLIREMRYPFSANRVMPQLQFYEWKLVWVSQEVHLNHYMWLASQAQSHRDSWVLNSSTLLLPTTSTLSQSKPFQPALKEIGVMRDYLPPLGKVKYGEGHLGKLKAQKTQSKATLGGRSSLLLMVLAQNISAHKPLCAPCSGPCQ